MNRPCIIPVPPDAVIGPSPMLLSSWPESTVELLPMLLSGMGATGRGRPPCLPLKRQGNHRGLPLPPYLGISRREAGPIHELRLRICQILLALLLQVI